MILLEILRSSLHVFVPVFQTISKSASFTSPIVGIGQVVVSVFFAIILVARHGM